MNGGAQVVSETFQRQFFRSGRAACHIRRFVYGHFQPRLGESDSRGQSIRSATGNNGALRHLPLLCGPQAFQP